MTSSPSVVGRVLRASLTVALAGAGLIAVAAPANAAPLDAAPRVVDDCPMPVQDVAILMDTTGSMSGAISAAQRTAVEAATKISDAGGQVALMEYKDAGDSVVSRVVQDFTTDAGAFQTATNTLYADGGGDSPEAVLSALDMAVNDLSWRPDSARAIILITDVDYHSPDVANPALTTETAIAQLTGANVQLFPILTDPNYASAYDALVAGAGGEIATLDDAETSIDEIINRVIDQVVSRPWVRFLQPGYTVEAGSPLHLPTESGADCAPLDIVDWAWDTTAGSPTMTGTATDAADLTYPTEGQFEVRVTITTADGQTATATVLITVTEPAVVTPTPTPTATPTETATTPPAPTTNAPAAPTSPTATAPSATPPALANTGGDGSSMVLAGSLAGAALLAGAVLLLVRRRAA